MDTKVMHDALAGSSEGRLTFPQVISMLVGAGVESYFVDFVHGDDTFYMPNGRTHVEPITLPAAPIADTFSASDVVAAIRAAQTDTIRYPEFVERMRKAGVAAYWAFLSGKKVIYFGRKGELHTEEFPR